MRVFHQRLLMVAAIVLIMLLIAATKPELLAHVPYVGVPLLVAGLVLETARVRKS